MEDREIKQEICDEILDVYNNSLGDLYVDTPQYISLDLFSTEQNVPDSHKVNLKINVDHSTKKEDSTPNSTYSDLQLKLDIDNKESKKRIRKKHIPSPKTCEVCGQQLSCAKGLRIHMRIHTDEKPFKCELCDKPFRQSSGLKSHLLTHSKEKPHPCPDCDGTFTTSSSMKRHRKRIHELGKQFTCNSCLEVFYNMASYKIHKSEKHLNTFNPRRCRECGEMLNSRTESRNHWTSVHKNRIQEVQRKINVCVLCGKEFNNFSLQVTHKYEHLQYTKDEIKCFRLDRMYPCKICGKRFSAINVITEHMATHMKATHKCELCNEKFSYYLYKKHKRKIHEEIECTKCNQIFKGQTAFSRHRYKTHIAPYQLKCQLCNKFQYNEKSLKVHMMTYHGGAVKLVQTYHNRCLYCNQYFARRGTLSRHIILYHSTNLKKISCHICTIKFEYYYEFHQHMQTVHHKVMGYKENECVICKKIFKNSVSLMSHMYRHRSNLLVDKKRKRERGKLSECIKKSNIKIRCKECGKICLNIGHFKRHLIVHSIKYKTCRFCNENYETVEIMKEHMATFHEDHKNFHCDFCNSDFSNLKTLMTHRKSQIHRKKFQMSLKFIIKNKFDKISNKEENMEDLGVINGPFIKNEELEIKEEPSIEETNYTDDNLNLMTHNKSQIHRKKFQPSLKFSIKNKFDKICSKEENMENLGVINGPFITNEKLEIKEEPSI